MQRYHYAVRAVKKNEDMITRQRFADAVLDADHRNFWSDIKRIRSSKSGVSYGICAIGNCWMLVGCGIKASAESGTYLTMLTALCCRCFVNVCQFLKNFVVDL